MNRARAGVLVLLLAAGGAVAYYLGHARPGALVLTGIVTTNDVIVSPQIAGQITQLLVNEGDTVKRDQLLAVIAPDELRADISYYSHNAAGMTSQVTEARAALRYQEQQTTDQIRQAEANLAATQAQEAEAEANLEKARMDLERDVLPSLAEAGELYVHPHLGFWRSMDTYKDALELSALCREGDGPWTTLPASESSSQVPLASSDRT